MNPIKYLLNIYDYEESVYIMCKIREKKWKKWEKLAYSDSIK